MSPRKSFAIFIALIQAMRPMQWAKNVVVFAGLVFDRQLGLNNLTAVYRTFLGFFVFCLLSGAVYIINDIADVDADRMHPDKRRRPIAAGRLPIAVAQVFVVLLLVIVFPFAYYLSPAFALVALSYFLLNLAYSKWLKHVPLLDVFSIALGYVLRVGAGITLIHVARFSPWLYVVTTLGSLLIGFGKRRAELAQMAGDANTTRRVLEGYTLDVLDQYMIISSATTIIAYSLYTFSAPNLPDNHVMMLTNPLVIYGIFRYLYLVQVKGCGGAPEEILFKDRPLQLTGLLWVASMLLIFYIF
jgi:4-hydroxybenzoate polyprenyltransferase